MNKFNYFASQWHSGQSSMLYAFSSSNGLKVGNQKLYNEEQNRYCTADEQLLSLYQDLQDELIDIRDNVINKTEALNSVRITLAEFINKVADSIYRLEMAIKTEKPVARVELFNLSKLRESRKTKGDCFKSLIEDGITFDTALPQQWLNEVADFAKQENSKIDYHLILNTTVWIYPEGKPLTCCCEVVDLIALYNFCR